MDSAEALVGRSLGRYRITALVGKGGMATVYKATHPGLGQTVAIKVLHPHMATDQDMLARFHNEAQAVANLRHPNIVRVLDFDVENDQYFMVMEYVDGPTLAGQLSGFAEQGRRMPADEVARIFEPLCSAVDYAHGQGMIHRDIKPANVLLTPQGEPVLTDYGIAKMVGVTQHTATGTVMGSAYYMSPEQAQGSGIDGRTDIYSLGVMLFEMLTGRVPFEGDTLATVLVKHITAPVPAVCTYNSQLPVLLDDVMGVALAKDPAQRFQTGLALSAAFRQGLAAPAAGAGETAIDRGTHGATATGGFTSVQPRGAAAAESLAARTATRDVYISYAAPDKQAAETVCARLEAEGVTCWIAPRDVLPGKSFAQALSGAIHAARVFVLVFSDATNGSQQVERELHMADASRLPVVPLRVEDVQPHESIEYYLAGRSWIEATTPPLDAQLGPLVENVSLLLLQTPPRQPAPVAPQATAVEPGAAAAGAAVPPATVAQPPVAGEAPPATAPSATTVETAAPAGAATETTLEPAPSPGVVAAAAAAAATGAAVAAAAVTPPATAPAATTVEPVAGPAPTRVEAPPAPPDKKAPEAPPAGAAPTTVEAPPPVGAAPTTVEAPPAAGAAPTRVEAPPPVAAAPTTVEAPAASAAAGATVLDGGAKAARPGPAQPVPRQPAARRDGEGLPATFRTRAVAAAAAVGVGWVVILFVLEKFVL